MLDIVTNHMAYMGCRACVDYSTLNPFNSVWPFLSSLALFDEGRKVI
jgi:alpha-amylase